jgi:hypothetical protein
MNQTLIETPYATVYETVYATVLDSSMWSLRQNGFQTYCERLE